MDYDVEMLAAIAASLGLVVDENTDALLDSVLRHHGSEFSVRLLWETLDAREQAALCLLAGQRGSREAVYFEDEYGSLRLFGSGRLVREHLWQHPANTTESLYFRGLIFRGFDTPGGAAVWFVPSDLLALLPVPECSTHSIDKPAPASAPVTVTRPADDAVPLAVYHVLISVRAGARQAEATAAGELAADLDGIDEQRLASLARLGAHLAQEMGFLSGRFLVPSGRARARRWLTLPRRRARAELAAVWLASKGWHELLQAPGLLYDGGTVPAPAPARTYLQSQVASLPAGVWFGVDEIKGWLRRSRPGFLRPNADFDSVHLRDQATGDALDGLQAWMGVEGRFVDEVLVILGGLGAVSVGATGEQRCFRVEPAAWWLDGGAQPAHAAPALSEDLTVEIDSEVPLLVRYELSRFAERMGKSRYQVTRRSLQAAESAGVGVESVLHYAEVRLAASAQALRRLRAVAAPASATASGVIAISSDDTVALAALSQDASITAALAGTLADGRLVIEREAWPLVLERMKQLGWRVQKRHSGDQAMTQE